MKHPRQRLFSGVVALIVLFLVGCATNQAPEADFTIDSATGTTEYVFAFDASNTSDPEGSALTFAWDFGDTEIGTGKEVTHQFAAPGRYVVELSVTDEAGQVGTAEETVTVSHTLAALGGEVMELMTEMNDLADAMSTDPAFLALATFPNLGTILPVGNLAQIVMQGELLRPEATLQGLLPNQMDQPLQRGEFVWVPSSGTWDLVDDTVDDLIMSWPFDDGATTKTAELTLDWDAAAPTQLVDDGFGTLFEVPVAMSATLTIDSAAAGDLALDFGWYDGPPCSQAILEPQTVAVYGEVGLNSVLTIGDASSTPVNPAEVAITDNTSGMDELATEGAAGFAWNGASVTVGWDASVEGLLSRFPPGGSMACFIDLDNIVVDSASLDLDVVSDVAGKSTDFHLMADVTSVDLATGTGDVAGSLEIDGIVTLTLSGTLEDSATDTDSIPDIVLTDVDGNEQSLAEFLESLTPEMAASLLRAIRVR